MIQPLRVSFEVGCGAEHAFSTWTERASVWWPKAHTMSGEDGAAIVFEARVGGRIFERTAAGAESEWGEVTAWDPPRRLAYLWHLAADRAAATDVEITFAEVGPGATRVDIVHSGWDRLGLERGRAWRDRNRGGWDGVLPDFAAACAAA